MYRFIFFMLALWVNPLFAKEDLVFKKELISNPHWYSYGLVLILLLISIIVLAKYSKRTGATEQKCKVIERISIHHKTKVYVIHYQGKQFLLADNQNALAIHPLHQTGLSHES
ncbi:hypothetical protein [uncultured Legionella sp.]|uniref:hypothetical protein n=1 Tax=uncultured Legionella sp. TaxID=210934 RepID=UPI002616A530|nr:hypothetical protein [uncultured Legionella sp.]